MIILVLASDRSLIMFVRSTLHVWVQDTTTGLSSFSREITFFCNVSLGHHRSMCAQCFGMDFLRQGGWKGCSIHVAKFINCVDLFAFDFLLEQNKQTRVFGRCISFGKRAVLANLHTSIMVVRKSRPVVNPAVPPIRSSNIAYRQWFIPFHRQHRFSFISASIRSHNKFLMDFWQLFYVCAHSRVNRSGIRCCPNPLRHLSRRNFHKRSCS